MSAASECSYLLSLIMTTAGRRDNYLVLLLSAAKDRDIEPPFQDSPDVE
jgi:hypothetical protein